MTEQEFEEIRKKKQYLEHFKHMSKLIFHVKSQ